MKKSRVLIACAVCAMTVLTTACGGNNGNSSNTSAPAQSSAAGNTSTNSSAVTSGNSTASVSSAPESSIATSAPAASTPADSTGLSHGTWSGKTYTSKFLGIKGDFPSDWVVTSDSELASAVGATEMSAEAMKTAMSSVGTVTEMMTATADQSSSVNIVIEDTSKTQTPNESGKYFSTMPAVAQQQLEAVGEALGVSMKANVSESSVSFLGEDTKCLYIILTVDGSDVHEIQVPIFKDNYVVNITFAAPTKAEAEALVASFTKA